MGTLTSDKEKVEYQFDALVKRVLRDEARNCKAKLEKRAAYDIPFADLGDSFIETSGLCNEYLTNCFQFEIKGFDIIIRNELLAEAVKSQSERKRNIIPMSYFLDMNDYDIADLLNLGHSTVTYHREDALGKLKRFIEENGRWRNDTIRNPQKCFRLKSLL